jgi:hypothetical protein
MLALCPFIIDEKRMDSQDSGQSKEDGLSWAATLSQKRGEVQINYVSSIKSDET